MYFVQLQRRLLDNLRLRVNNGEVTERSLARLVGVSQPHIHNVLKGLKILSPKSCDRILERLDMSILDLVEAEAIAGHLHERSAHGRASALVRVLDSRLGPGCGWPVSASTVERFAISAEELHAMAYPVAARLADDPRMRGVFSADDWVILDQSVHTRVEIDSDAFYLVKVGQDALVRRIRLLANSMYLVSEDSTALASDWQQVRVSRAELPHVIRARVRFVPPLADWQCPPPVHFRAAATSR